MPLYKYFKQKSLRAYSEGKSEKTQRETEWWGVGGKWEKKERERKRDREGTRHPIQNANTHQVFLLKTPLNVQGHGEQR